MKELAHALIEHLRSQWGDLGLVTPSGFATALRSIGNVPDDATPAHIEHWVRSFGEVRVNAASPDVPGFGWRVGDSFVIETGKGRSPQERNITIPHEFGERLQHMFNDELAARGMLAVEWGERFWDAMGVALVAPLAPFRTAALKSGMDLVDLAKALSLEAAVYRVKEAFEDDVPIFAVYSGNAGEWTRERGYRGNTWTVRASARTKRWLSCSYVNGREGLYVPRRGEQIRDASFAREVCSRRRPLVVNTTDVVDGRVLETTVILRGKFYGTEPAWVMAVGVERRYGHLLRPQLDLADPLERAGAFGRLF